MNNIEERIKLFNQSLPASSLQLKYQRMSEDAFGFFRGTCHLFYEDLAKENNLPESPLSWICGDLHMENFGSYKADNRLVYFDLNDFNEAVLAPLSWEILRMTTSIFIALGCLKIDRKEIQKSAELFLQIYSQVLKDGKARYIEPQVAKGIVRKFLKKVSNRTEKELLKERAFKKNGKLHLRIDNKHIFPLDRSLKEELSFHIDEWIKKNNKAYNCLDVVFRIAGTGSIGVKRYLFLLEEKDKIKNYLLIDMKEAIPSSVHRYLSVKQPWWENEAERMITVQNYMQNNCPAFLSFTNFKNSSFIVKELQPSEDKIKFTATGSGRKDIRQVISDMALLTASGQIRSTGRKGSGVVDELISFGTADNWQKRILHISSEYSDRMKSYYNDFLKRYEELSS